MRPSFKSAVLFCMATATTSVLLAQNGTNDPALLGYGFNNGVERMAVQEDGRILAAGYFESYSGTTVNRVARLYPDGTLDASFDPGAGISGTATRVVRIQPNDGKILLAGYYYSYDNTPVSSIFRVNTDGSLDNTFQVTDCNDQINALAVQEDGKIIIGGWFTEINGTSVNRIVRLNTDGSIDPTFNVGIGADSYVLSIAIQEDGKVLIGGAFTNYNGVYINRLARLNANGSLDDSFQVGSGANGHVLGLLIQPDGKIIISGSFYGYNGVNNPRVMRVNADGSPDDSFRQTGTGIGGEVYGVALQPDGKLVVGGYFSTYNDQPVGRVVRLHANGKLDHHFPMTGANSTVNSVAVLPDNRIVVAGEFTTYHGQTRNAITILQNCIFSTLNIGMPESICPYATADLSVTSDQGVQSWYSAAIDGDYLSAGAAYETPSLSSTTTFYVQDSLECGISVFGVDVTVRQIETTIIPSGGSLYVNNIMDGVSYQWIDCSDMSIIEGQTDRQFTPTANGDYAAIVYLDGCADTSACESVTGLGLDDEVGFGAVEVFPNPATDALTLRIVPERADLLTLTLLDATGRRVQEVGAQWRAVPGERMERTVPLHGHPPGLYTLSIASEHGGHLHRNIIIAP